MVSHLVLLFCTSSNSCQAYRRRLLAPYSTLLLTLISTSDMRAPVALLAVLFAFLALVSASASTHSSTGAHGLGLVKRACATKTCLTNQYIAQSKAVVDARVVVQQLVAEEKKVAAQLKRAVKGGKKYVKKVKAFKKRKAALLKKVKAAKASLGTAKHKVSATKAALKKLGSGSSSSGGSSSSSFTSKKRGLSYNYPKLTTAFTKISSVSWTYNWDQKPLAGVSTAPEFVPMLWGPDHASTWSKNAKAAIKKGSTHLLGMNEPDLASQSNMTVAAAIKLWKKQMVPLASSEVKLVSPAVTGTLEGIQWLTDFVKGCKNCKISAVAVHWYDRADNVAWFKLYLSKIKALGLPIWITEFAPSGTVSEQQAFFEEVLPWMEKQEQSYIERYAAFGDYIGTFVKESGALTPLGKTYATA
ncbi:glycosyl hydrolase catalytic core-domain-containing protein [Leucosporidium creatinivorum]|uniref:Glycosyl hydrolase catalytic core-domain-containing protein n=1 Tax=Leucosporidium creatinivorum TaxID=106004 RepID=A0A1Y2FW25_9BASI|nr:glycosyl hydrolase catalytic core-domain-containing protein [Leucosporidium creatinivorum]